MGRARIRAIGFTGAFCYFISLFIFCIGGTSQFGFLFIIIFTPWVFCKFNTSICSGGGEDDDNYCYYYLFLPLSHLFTGIFLFDFYDLFWAGFSLAQMKA